MVVILAVALIGCGGSDNGSVGGTGATGFAGTAGGVGNSTGSTTSTATAGSTGNEGSTGGTTLPGVLDVRMEFSDAEGTNADTTTLTEVDPASLLQYTEEGAQIWMIHIAPEDYPRRAFQFSIPVEIKAGQSYNYTEDTSISRPYADYVEIDEAHAPIQIWWAKSGKVTVVSVTSEAVTLRFDDIRFAPEPDGTDAAGTFTVSGTVRLRNYEHSDD